MTWRKWAGAALAVAALFVGGYKYAASIGNFRKFDVGKRVQ